MGYNILHQNYFSNFGEIDIIIQKENIIAFVEIKTRSSNLETCLNSISRRKQKKIIKTALIYIENNPKFEDFIFRFDVIAIVIKNQQPRILHIEDAFSPLNSGIYSN